MHRLARLYASDLTGASAGCLIVLGGLEMVDAPSLMLWCSGIGVLAGACFARVAQSRAVRRYIAFALLFFVLGIANAQTPYGIRPMFVKEKFQRLHDQILERWNSFSRVVVYRQQYLSPQFWGGSPVAEGEKIYFHGMTIDGAASTAIGSFVSPKDIEHLRYDVTNVGYYLDRRGKACIIGVGWGQGYPECAFFWSRRGFGY